MSPRVAVVGAGMTKFVRRAQETGKELSWIATREALASCELKLTDVDAVCLTSAPDAFDGVHRKGDYLADGAGANNIRLHHNVSRSANHEQMLDVVTADQEQPAPAVNSGRVDNGEPGLAPTSSRRPEIRGAEAPCQPCE